MVRGGADWSAGAGPAFLSHGAGAGTTFPGGQQGVSGGRKYAGGCRGPRGGLGKAGYRVWWRGRGGVEVTVWSLPAASDYLVRTERVGPPPGRTDSTARVRPRSATHRTQVGPLNID